MCQLYDTLELLKSYFFVTAMQNEKKKNRFSSIHKKGENVIKGYTRGPKWPNNANPRTYKSLTKIKETFLQENQKNHYH